MYSEENIIEAVLENNDIAQSMFYNLFAPKMYGVCLRYAGNRMEADDILQEGFIKVFLNLNTFRKEGSLEGWIRRTIINTAINLNKQNARYRNNVEIEKVVVAQNNSEHILQKFNVNDLLKMVMNLPPGYRMIFNLYVIEGYSHKEISEMLGISENTSKSQLLRARIALKNKINFKDNDSYITF